MNNDGAGCIGTVLVLAALIWVPLHFSGKSILFGRTESQYQGLYGTNYVVLCIYFTSTGTEEIRREFDGPASRSAFYCPRLKDIGKEP